MQRIVNIYKLSYMEPAINAEQDCRERDKSGYSGEHGAYGTNATPRG